MTEKKTRPWEAQEMMTLDEWRDYKHSVGAKPTEAETWWDRFDDADWRGFRAWCELGGDGVDEYEVILRRRCMAIAYRAMRPTLERYGHTYERQFTWHEKCEVLRKAGCTRGLTPLDAVGRLRAALGCAIDDAALAEIQCGWDAWTAKGEPSVRGTVAS